MWVPLPYIATEEVMMKLPSDLLVKIVVTSDRTKGA